MRRFKRRGVFSIFELFENSTATRLQSSTALAGVAIASGEIKKKSKMQKTRWYIATGTIHHPSPCCALACRFSEDSYD
jgi:hypothetical protein